MTPTCTSPAKRKFAITNIAVNPYMTGAKAIFGIAIVMLMAACATAPGGNPKDPWESYNRGMTKFNDGVDSAVLKPVAMAYREVTPPMVRTGVSNFFGNLTQLWTAVNGALQLRGQVAVESLMRFNVNFFFGLGGVLDIASEMGIERHSEDFGQTLGRWGVPTGPYLVLPLLGPSTLRDASAFTVQAYGDPVAQINDTGTRTAFSVLRIVDTRSNLLRAGSVLDAAALDKYSFLRDVYLQRRESEVFDGIDRPPSDLPADE